MIHNQLASTWTLAKSMRMTLDASQAETKLPTATLALLLDTVIELAQADNKTAKRMESASTAFVAGRMTGLES